MKAYICDQCNKHEQADRTVGVELPPTGWYTLIQYSPRNAQPTFCSADCLAQHVQALVLAADARPAQAEVARG